MSLVSIFEAKIEEGDYRGEIGNTILIFIVDDKKKHCEYDEIERRKGNQKPNRPMDSQKEAAREYWGSKCIAPDCDDESEVLHHILPRFIGGDNSPQNLAPLCDYHHGSTYISGSKENVSHPIVYEVEDIPNKQMACTENHLHWVDEHPNCDHGTKNYMIESTKLFRPDGDVLVIHNGDYNTLEEVEEVAGLLGLVAQAHLDEHGHGVKQ
jgi:hypothetical protein